MTVNFNFNETIDKIFAGFKKITPILLAIDLSAGLILFLPDNIISKLYMLNFRMTYGFCIGLLFLIFSTLIVIIILSQPYKWIVKKMQNNRFRKNGVKILLKMNISQKDIIREMYQNDSRTLSLDYTESTTHLLEAMVVITRGSSVSNDCGYDSICFSYYLQPWVIDYIDKNPEYL